MKELLYFVCVTCFICIFFGGGGVKARIYTYIYKFIAFIMPLNSKSVIFLSL